MSFFENSLLLLTHSLIACLPAFSSSVQASFFPGMVSLGLTPLKKYSVTLQLAFPRRRLWPQSFLVIVLGFFPNEMKELCTFSLDQQVSAHFSLFLPKW